MALFSFIIHDFTKHIINMSDSNYALTTRHRKPYSTSGRPPTLEIVDDEWAAHTLSDDDLDLEQQEAVLAPFLDEGDLDVDAIVVSTVHSGSAGPSSGGGAAATSGGGGGGAGSDRGNRFRRDGFGRWADLGLDYLDGSQATGGAVVGDARVNLPSDRRIRAAAASAAATSNNNARGQGQGQQTGGSGQG